MANGVQPVGSAISTLLVATDFSETAAVALDRASELARSQGARIVLAHGLTVQPIPFGAPSHVILPPSIDEEIRRVSRQRLEALADGLRARGLEVDVELTSGDTGQCVVDMAAECGADLIVIGTRGLSRLQHLVLGSTAELVVRRAACPVLTVHPGDGRSLEAAKLVVLPCELHEDPTPAVVELRHILASKGPATRILLAYSDHLPAFLQPLVEDLGLDRIGFDEIADELQERLVPAADRIRALGFEVEVVLREGDPVSVITELAKESGADLIAMETRGRSGLAHLFLGSTAERVVQRATCPVLTVHRPHA
jgi:nucleotide-binding universal stress UspA family protein